VSQSARVRVSLYDALGMLATTSSPAFTLQDAPTTTPQEPRTESQVTLHSAPNPFRAGGSTTIGFHLPAASPVSLKIYDVAGRLVRTLRDERMEPGRHTVAWDGLDDDRRQAAAGVYFARLRVDGAQRTRRVLLLR